MEELASAQHLLAPATSMTVLSLKLAKCDPRDLESLQKRDSRRELIKELVPITPGTLRHTCHLPRCTEMTPSESLDNLRCSSQAYSFISTTAKPAKIGKDFPQLQSQAFQNANPSLPSLAVSTRSGIQPIPTGKGCCWHAFFLAQEAVRQKLDSNFRE